MCLNKAVNEAEASIENGFREYIYALIFWIAVSQAILGIDS